MIFSSFICVIFLLQSFQFHQRHNIIRFFTEKPFHIIIIGRGGFFFFFSIIWMEIVDIKGPVFNCLDNNRFIFFQLFRMNIRSRRVYTFAIKIVLKYSETDKNKMPKNKKIAVNNFRFVLMILYFAVIVAFEFIILDTNNNKLDRRTTTK